MAYAKERNITIIPEIEMPGHGWDEMLQGGISPNATLMSWQDEKSGKMPDSLQTNN